MESIIELKKKETEIEKKIEEFERKIGLIFERRDANIAIYEIKKHERGEKRNGIELSIGRDIKLTEKRINQLKELIGLFDYEIKIYDGCTPTSIKFYETEKEE